MKTRHIIPFVFLAVILVGSILFAHIRTGYVETALKKAEKQEQKGLEIERKLAQEESFAEEQAAEVIMIMNEAKRIKQKLKACNNR